MLATKADGLLTAVQDGVTGHLVEPRTPEAWASAIEKLVRAPEERRSLGAAGAARAAHLRWDDTADHLFELYSQLLHSTYSI